MYGCGVHFSCTAETIIMVVMFIAMIALLAIVIWLHDHRNHKPWKHKCGWTKIDGMWHWYKQKDVKKRCGGGGGCNPVKCLKHKGKEKPLTFHP